MNISHEDVAATKENIKGTIQLKTAGVESGRLF